MKEIEKKAEQYAEKRLNPPDSPEWKIYPDFRDDLKTQISDGYKSGAAAVIELIRERMPGYQHPLGPLARENKGYNNAIEDVVKLLDTIK